VVAVIYSAGSLAPPRFIRALSNQQAVQVVSDASFDEHDDDAVLYHLKSSALLVLSLLILVVILLSLIMSRFRPTVTPTAVSVSVFLVVFRISIVIR